MMLNREVRRVPLGYEPPRNVYGHYCPVFDQFYADALREWQEAKRKWDAGERPDYCSAANRNLSYEEWDGPAPNPDYYLPGATWPEGTVLGICMYETVTEGTPISAVYPDRPDGYRAMAEEIVAKDTSITRAMTVADWLEVINNSAVAPLGTDVVDRSPVRA